MHSTNQILRKKVVGIVGILIWTITLWGCRSSGKYGVSLSSFSSAQRSALEKALSYGDVQSLDSAGRILFTDQELIRLTHSESPNIRALAFIELFNYRKLDHFPLVMGHLDDTAHVVHNHGCWGYDFETVTELMLENAEWATEELRDSTLSQLMALTYGYRDLYYAIQMSKPNAKYHDSIVRMIKQPRMILEGYHSSESNLKFRALHALAKYKRKEDIVLMKQQYLENVFFMNNMAFTTLREFPDNNYMDVLERYHRKCFYRTLNNTPYEGICMGSSGDDVTADDFLSVLAVHQNARSAAIIDTMMQWIPRVKFLREPESIMYSVMELFNNSTLPEYQFLKIKYRKALEAHRREIAMAKKERERYPDLPVEDVVNLGEDPDTTKHVYTWTPWR